MTKETISLTKDLVWPWSSPYLGLWALIVAALVLAAMTIWTYTGVKRVSRLRVGFILVLRLLALVLACMMILRPSLAFRESVQLPSTLLLVLDASESMTFQDEFGNQSRWNALNRHLKDCEPILKELQENQDVTIVRYHFAADARPFDPQAVPDGRRTDFGQSLQTLFQQHRDDRNLRGLLIVSDGTDNGTRFPSLNEAARWRALSCPIHTFGLGQPTTSEQQRDIVLVAIHPEPSPVPVKGKLTVKGVLDAFGFENAAVTVRLFLDDKEVQASKEVLRKSKGNEIILTTDAPATPGEIKVTLKVDPLPGEMSLANNEIGTYVTVTKEGIAVLFADRLRLEQKFIRHALEGDRRIRLFMAWRVDEDAPGGIDPLQLEKQHYDVIILGDLSAKRLCGGDRRTLQQIHDLVKNKGTGFMMMGGEDSFSNSDWNRTPIADLLPVRLDEVGQIGDKIRMEPTKEGFAHYLMRLTEPNDANKELWQKLPALDGMTKMGRIKPGSTVLAASGNETPVLVYQKYGEGRTLAFAGDTTWRWQRLGQPKSSLGVDAHARFWRQLVLFLAKQDEKEGGVWVKPDTRRLPSGSKLGFSVGMVGKGGVEAKEARFEVKVISPQKAETVVPTAQDQGAERGVFWKSEAPGEYRIEVVGKGTDKDGKEINGKASARFLVYQDDAELMRKAADHDFLQKLAQTGGGKFHRAQELRDFLKSLQQSPLSQGPSKTHLWPDWRRGTQYEFLTSYFLLFVAVLSLEWLLRRSWGLV